jgi:hypothetical protein
MDGFYEETDFGNFLKERYPFGFRSALVFVDHCDFDSAKKVEAVFYGTSNPESKDYGRKGIVGSGLTATKSIFVDATGTENLGLGNKEYEAIVKKLFRDGVEIVPHSLRPKTSLLKNDKRLVHDLKIMQQFNSQTWVDHGYALHNLSRFGWDEQNPNYILDKLTKRGYRFFWSRIDYSLNSPAGNLNLLTIWGRVGKDYWEKVLRLVQRKEKFPRVIFVFFWDFIGNLIGSEGKDDLLLSLNMVQLWIKKIRRQSGQELFTPTAGPILRTMGRIFNPLFYLPCLSRFFLPDKITSQTATVFPVKFRDVQVYFFNSLWINDFVGGYSPAHINRLIKEKGFHIGHNYFCVEAGHYLSQAVIKKGNGFHISEGFQKNLDWLAKCQKEKKVLVGTISQLGNFVAAWLKVEVKLVSPGRLWVKNWGETAIKGLTFSYRNSRKLHLKVTPRKIIGEKREKKETIFWLDLSPGEELLLEVL